MSEIAVNVLNSAKCQLVIVARLMQEFPGPISMLQPMPSNGRHFLQIPGPTTVPDRVLRAISQSVIDHRGPRFAEITNEVLSNLRLVFKTTQPVVVFPSSGTGAWEAALVNTLSPGDQILMYDTGHFSGLWRDVALNLGYKVHYLSGDWRSGASPQLIERTLRDDKNQNLKAVAIVHNETSTGVASQIPLIRKAIDSAGHPALLLVDTISSLGSMDYFHDGWGVDVTVAGSQKGLMLPPGLAFNAISEKALEANRTAQSQRAYWDWHAMLSTNVSGFFPYTPATNLIYGLRESLQMLLEEGLDQVFARHERHARATRAAVEGWNLEILCREAPCYSPSLTAVLMPKGHDADRLRQLILERFNLSLGTGLGKLKGRVFRIGHLGDFNDLMLCATLCGIEMGLAASNTPFSKHGTASALAFLAK